MPMGETQAGLSGGRNRLDQKSGSVQTRQVCSPVQLKHRCRDEQVQGPAVPVGLLHLLPVCAHPGLAKLRNGFTWTLQVRSKVGNQTLGDNTPEDG
ncbi:hypothetical protein [Paenibacillus periandrae]|uniref:hypothetical protein n=1 Tax=Paenibacillus periandrae TaxID=1761741 RepID=UPI001F09901C|nr:hypothetical protein [Paenibacillus periandrae]